jgi:hypothetical protein
MAEFIVMLTFICLTFFLLLFSALYKHMDGLTNDVERSNEMVGFIVHVATTKLPAIFFSLLSHSNCQLLLGVHPARGVRS